MGRTLVAPEQWGYAPGMYPLFAFLVLALGAADVYRWVDADGQAHYTDRPQPGAERIAIEVGPKGGKGSRSSTSSSSSTQAQDDETTSPIVSYQSLTITTPAQEQVLWNIEGQLETAAAVDPPLQPGHALRFYLDGRMEQAEPGTTRTRYSEVVRGEHLLRVEVVDASGQTLATSPTSKFFVRQPAIPNPVPPRP